MNSFKDNRFDVTVVGTGEKFVVIGRSFDGPADDSSSVLGARPADEIKTTSGLLVTLPPSGLGFLIHRGDEILFAMED